MSEIITEGINQKTTNIDIISTLDMVKKINDEDKAVAYAVERELEHIARAIDTISDRFEQGGKLIYFGCGTSGRLGMLDASECPPTFSVESDLVQGIMAGGKGAFINAVEGAEDDFEQGEKDAQILTQKDVCVVVSASGNPKYLLGVLKTAKLKGSKRISVTCNHDAKIKNETEICICPETGAEVIAGSSRLKAGTAQKMVLNMLSTGAMIKCGKTYKNFMIDLKPTNDKLKDRAIKIVKEIAQTDYSKALETLLKTNWEIKPSIISIKLGLEIEDAKQKLKENKGVLRKVLKIYE